MRACCLFLILTAVCCGNAAERADLIFHGGKVVTVNDHFRIAEGLAVTDGLVSKVGTDQEVMALRDDQTEVVDLEGRLLMPGLIDSHVHPSSASLHEFDHEVPEMESIEDVLAYIASRAAALPEGDWINVKQVFITRLKEPRYPTKAELDRVAPKHPVAFSTGPDSMLNSLALKESEIDRDFKVVGSGYVEMDRETGEPTGLLRSCARYIKSKPSGRQPTPEDRLQRLEALFADYNSVGLTTVADRNATDRDLEFYQLLKAGDRLSVRLMASAAVDVGERRLSDIQEQIRKLGEHKLRAADPRLRIIGIKTFLDGGMLTGSAYMREPWGKSSIYLIDDDKYRGVLFIERDKLLPIVEATVDAGLQFTAHSVGDGAVHQLLDVYEQLSITKPIRGTRPCITHCNFMSREAIDRMAKLGVMADIQPAWLYLDARTLTRQFGVDRLRYFQPLRSCFEEGVIIGGGSDHMQKIGSLRSVNPYNPFLGMWVAITRQARWFDGELHPEESLSREQAIRFYTANNARLLFLEDQVGSLEVGKRADLVVLDRDLLKCPIDDVKDTKVLRTYSDGKLIFQRNGSSQ
jgi:predicted amidohydrolase YtcJ